MFGALGRVAARRPWFVIVGWVIFAIVVIAFSPKLTATTDQADFLPSHYESIKAQDLQTTAFPDAAQPAAIIVFDRTDGKPLTTADQAEVKKVVGELQPDLGKAFKGIAAQPPSPNKLVELAVIGQSDSSTGFDQEAFDSVKALRAQLGTLMAGSDLDHGVTGSAATSYDQQEASKNAEAIVGGVTILLILVLLGIIFRSVIIALMPLVVVGVVSQVATGLIGLANKIFDLKIDSSVQVILIVVLFGVGTDYILFFLFRYRERRRQGEDTKASVEHALERAGEAIASAGGAVIVSFLALTLSSLGIFKSIGPALAIAVAVTLVAALTLVPAVVTVLGKAVFWPSNSWRREPKQARSGAIGDALAKRPAVFAAVSGGVLVILAIFAFGFAPNFDLGSSGSSSTAESSVALTTLEKGLPAGATNPTTVLLHSTDGQPLSKADIAAYTTKLKGADGVASVTPGAVSPDGLTENYSVVLSTDPTSDAAIAAVKGPIRDTAHSAAPTGTEAYVGGETSVFVDFQTAENRDYSVVFPVAAIVILIILALLLRSLVAPIYLMVSVGLGFGATLGAAVILFQHIAGNPGIIFLLPIYIYLFVVALGTDYNILMIARLREEARDGKDPREAAAQAVKHAGPTIAAAGLILAGSFGSLMFGGNKILVDLGFSVAFGIVVSAFVMAMFFTPAVTALLGHRAWWPGHGDAVREKPELPAP